MDIEQMRKELKRRHISYEEFSSISKVPLNTLKNIFSGRTKNPRIDTMQAIEKALGIADSPPPYSLIDQTQRRQEYVIQDEVPLNELYPIPLLGSVVAGVPIEAQEDLEGYIYINYKHNEEYFALRVHGNSMINAGIRDKSVLVVHKQETAENGDIVVAMLNGEQTVKRLKLYDNGLTFLMPENPEFAPIPVVNGKDDLKILGKVIEIRIPL